MLALANAALGQLGAAIAHLDAAIDAGGLEGYRRVFLDEGAPIAALLNRYLAVAPPGSRRAFAEVLRLVAAGASNCEIAEQIVVAVGTVKRHINTIFGKLGAARRSQAVARARELDLL